MAARQERRGVLAVTTSGRSSAILTERNRQLCKGFDVTYDLSLLASGPCGWVQSANFILTATNQ
jgi:hypothetical protein